MSHTPGPWTYVANWQCPGHLKGGFVSSYDAEIGVNPRIADVSAIAQGSQERCDANGRLIAAAPDLLEGAILQSECGYPEPSHAYDEECVECWKWTHPDGRTWFELGGHDEPPPLHPVLAAAIAKAKEGSA